jgi:hypothetical protein
MIGQPAQDRLQALGISNTGLGFHLRSLDANVSAGDLPILRIFGVSAVPNNP